MTIHYSALNDKFWIRDGDSEGVLWFDTEAAAREYQRTEQLRTVLQREADTQRRHDEKVERLEAENERLREALELADAALRGANMNMNVLERKVHEALGETK